MNQVNIKKLLTSNKLSPTRHMSNLCSLLSNILQAFSAANIDVKSNIAISGLP